MPDDLLSRIEDIESKENVTKVLQEKIDRLKELVKKQKVIISEQGNLIDEQRGSIGVAYDVPADVIELKEIIGSQRALLNEREIQLEHAKGGEAQAFRELELVQRQMEPLQERINDSYQSIGQLRAELAEQKSQVIIKDEKIKSLENKIIELEMFEDKIKDEEVKLLEAIEKKYMKEKQELKAQISKLDFILLDSRLISTEKTSEAKDIASRFDEIRQKHEDLINKVGELSDKNREANEKNRRLEVQMEDLKKFKMENTGKVNYFEKLRPLMEQEVIFKSFLIINDVGGSGIAIEDLQKSLGAPAVLVKRHIQTLEKINLIEQNPAGKLVVKKEEID